VKITGAKVNQPIQTLGRGSTAAIRAKAASVAGLSSAQVGVVNHLAEVGAEYVDRKDRMELSKNSSSFSVESDDWVAETKPKQEFTAAEVRGQIPEGSVKLTEDVSMPDGTIQQTDRMSIPRHEVYPYLLDNKMKSLTEAKANNITNPLRRAEFVERATEYSSRLKLGAVLESAKEQRVYEVQETRNEVDRLIDSKAKPQKIRRVAENMPGTKMEKQEYMLEVNRRLEWSLDSTLINQANIPGMQARLTELQNEKYGSAEKDSFGEDSASGGPVATLNQEAAINRLQRELNAAKGAKTYASTVAIEEAIKARANGNMTPGILGLNIEDAIKYINAANLGLTTKARLIESAKSAQYEGDARTDMSDTSLLDDSYRIQALENALLTADPTLTNELEAQIKAAGQVRSSKEKAFETYPSDYVLSNFEQAQAAFKRLQEEDKTPDGSQTTLRLAEYKTIQKSIQVDSLGIHPLDVKLLSEGQVKEFQMNTRSDNPAQLLSQMEGLETLYGEADMGLVYNQLLDEGVLEDGHIMAMQIRKDAPALAMRYTHAVSKLQDAMKIAVVKTSMSEIETDASEALDEIRFSLFPSGAMPEDEAVTVIQQITAMEKGLVAMAAVDTMANGTYSKSKLTNNVKALIDANWIFSDRGVRIPRNKGYDEKLVLRGLHGIQRNYKLAPGVAIHGQDLPGLSPKDSDDAYMLRFKQFAVPGTNGDESGIVWHWTSTGDPVMIRNDDGQVKILETSYTDIETFGADLFQKTERRGTRPAPHLVKPMMVTW